MNNLQEFNFRGNNVRTVQINNEPYFVGKDSAMAIGYTELSSRNALKAHVKPKYKKECQINTPSGKQTMIVISEPGMYQLASQSKLADAEEFQDWVYEDVLPTIRKHGAYLTDSAIEQTLTDPDYLIKLATQLKTEREGRLIAEQNVKTMKPKALFADSVSISKTDISIGDMAKILKGNGINIGRNRFFKWLRDNGYLIKRAGNDYNSPTQKSMELGLFRVKESSRIDSNGMTIIMKTPIVTGKGQQYFVNKFLNADILLEV